MKGVLNANYCLYKKRITKVREKAWAPEKAKRGGKDDPVYMATIQG